MESLKELYSQRAELGMVVHSAHEAQEHAALLRYAQHRLWVKQREQEWNAAWEAQGGTLWHTGRAI